MNDPFINISNSVTAVAVFFAAKLVLRLRTQKMDNVIACKWHSGEGDGFPLERGGLKSGHPAGDIYIIQKNL
ncbi:Hypothetical protein AKI40_3432 [Enterobacter sp. FY-07]|uniref:hypothetical protein n=1 Tax=Kosakonia oryzendophytica TaxID=1005665 RepID=UPI000776DF2C|nr:hypothetical protein [Kosakonia oryzendophytica]AMO49812.1 Hypothetical protein AKI40_3432 [Enterobacter sp. FY-07]WBT60262.1 hypothetical protein O9K67_11045 [Kosakonia oryzendophytica]